MHILCFVTFVMMALIDGTSSQRGTGGVRITGQMLPPLNNDMRYPMEYPAMVGRFGLPLRGANVGPSRAICEFGSAGGCGYDGYCPRGTTCNAYTCCRDTPKNQGPEYPVCEHGAVGTCGILGRDRCPRGSRCNYFLCCRVPEPRSPVCEKGSLGACDPSDWSCPRNSTCTRGFCCKSTQSDNHPTTTTRSQPEVTTTASQPEITTTTSQAEVTTAAQPETTTTTGQPEVTTSLDQQEVTTTGQPDIFTTTEFTIPGPSVCEGGDIGPCYTRGEACPWGFACIRGMCCADTPNTNPTPGPPHPLEVCDHGDMGTCDDFGPACPVGSRCKQGVCCRDRPTTSTSHEVHLICRGRCYGPASCPEDATCSMGMCCKPEPHDAHATTTTGSAVTATAIPEMTTWEFNTNTEVLTTEPTMLEFTTQDTIQPPPARFATRQNNQQSSRQPRQSSARQARPTRGRPSRPVAKQHRHSDRHSQRAGRDSNSRPRRRQGQKTQRGHRHTRRARRQRRVTSRRQPQNAGRGVRVAGATGRGRCPAPPGGMVSICVFSSRPARGQCITNSDCNNGKLCCWERCNKYCRDPVL